MVFMFIHIQIAYEMDLISQIDSMQDLFEVKWEKYVHINLKYALPHETPSKDLRNAIRKCVSLKDDGEFLVSPETSVTSYYTYILVSIVNCTSYPQQMN